VQAEIAAVKARQEIDNRKIQELGEEVQTLRALITPPSARVKGNPHYDWAVSHQKEVRAHVGRWLGINADRGGIVANGDRMVDVRNAVRDAGLLYDSYIIFVPPAR
jgi:hypothetical protein